MSLISRLLGKSDHRDAVRPLWLRVVEIGRERQWYAECGVADTVAGRFDAVTMVMALVILRMDRDKETDNSLINPAARLTELFVTDMDGQLRQSGVGDLVVGKRMGKLMGVLGGRIGALRDALARDDTALVPVVERNMTMVEGADPGPLANRVRELHAALNAVSNEDLLAARIAR